MASISSVLSLIDSISLDSDEIGLRECVVAIRDEFSFDEDVAASLARKLAASGVCIHQGDSAVADVASTGGPSSLSTLLCPLLLRAAGVIVPKLGVPGRPAGGIDCLGQIPGYRTSLSADEVKHVLGWSGYAHFLAEGQFAPLDGKLFRLRQSEGAQAVPTLVSASLIAKKIAVGVKSVGLDIRVASHGNFGDSWDIAKRNARLFVDCAKLVGIEAHPVLTDARFPCQPFFGRRESLVALSEIFGGKMSPWLRHHVDICRTLAMVCVSEGRSKSISSAGPDILRRHFNENIEAQGGLVGDFEKLVAATRGEHSIILRAIKAGFCRYPLKELRDAFVAWQKRSECPSSPFPDPVGLVFLHPPGTWVGKNEGVATLRADASVLSEAIDQLTKLVCIPSTHPLGLGVEGLNE